MITGQLKKELTIENVLKLVSEYDIFRAFMPNTNWKLNDAIISPFFIMEK